MVQELFPTYKSVESIEGELEDWKAEFNDDIHDEEVGVNLHRIHVKYKMLKNTK